MSQLEKMRKFAERKNLTVKETELWNEIVVKYDDNCGFLTVDEITSFSGKVLSGLLSSLNSKGLISSGVEEALNNKDIEIWVIDQENPKEVIFY